MTVAAQLKKQIGSAGYTQAGFAAEIGFSAQYVSEVLAGRKEISDEFALALAQHLPVNPIRLVQRQVEERMRVKIAARGPHRG